MPKISTFLHSLNPCLRGFRKAVSDFHHLNPIKKTAAIAAAALAGLGTLFLLGLGAIPVFRGMVSLLRKKEDSTASNTAAIAKQIFEPKTASFESFKTGQEKRDSLGNTPLTSALANLAYGDTSGPDPKTIIVDAINGGNTVSLIRPNRPIKIIPSTPVNTPLLLAIKADRVDLVQLLLPYYSANDLFHKSSLDNNALHVAVGHGRFFMAYFIWKRAKELGIAEQMISATNKKGKSVKDLAQWMIPNHKQDSRKLAFKKVDDLYCDIYMGEEARKSKIGLGDGLHIILKNVVKKEFQKMHDAGLDRWEIAAFLNDLDINENSWGFQQGEGK